jgi:hypothetical protein
MFHPPVVCAFSGVPKVRSRAEVSGMKVVMTTTPFAAREP